MMNDRWLGWHFLREDGRTGYGGRKPVPGVLMRCRGELELCVNGLHASERPIDALNYAPGPIVQRVELVGRRIDDRDKSCARSRRCLWIADATRVLHEFALWSAERALETERLAGHEPDRRSVEALDVKRLWLDGEATDEEMAAAKSAARAAAWDAVRFEARAAAGSAAWAAAWDAVKSAAGSGVLDVAMGAVRDVYNAELHARLMALAPEGYMEISDD